MAEREPISVSQLARKIRNLLDIDLGELWIEGEVSNLRLQNSGHQYFTLKDANAQLSCVMFKGNAQKSRVALKDGLRLKVFAAVSIYEARGSLQLVVQKVEELGAGQLQARFEALKKQLAQEGLFDAAKKQALPAYPRVIGLVTSPTGAAVQDLLNVLRRRAPWVRVFLAPVRVQGMGAEREIAAAIQSCDAWSYPDLPKPDLLIVGRGGGSLEDLWNFNEECVARAIAACSIPVISAVGHEIDFTIADFVADLRAPTPSAAAELAVPDGETLLARLEQLKMQLKQKSRHYCQFLAIKLSNMDQQRLKRSVTSGLRDQLQRLDEAEMRLKSGVSVLLEKKSQRLQRIEQSLQTRNLNSLCERKLDQLTHLNDRLKRAIQLQIKAREQKLDQSLQWMKSLGPERTLQRGYSITFDAAGKVLRDPAQLQTGEHLKTRLASGEVHSQVTKI